MKYMLLIYQNPANWDALPENERNAVFQEVDALVAELTERGEFIGGDGLADHSQTKTVRVRDGVPAVTDVCPWVTTAPSWATPSLISTPALIHVASVERRSTPAWSNCSP